MISRNAFGLLIGAAFLFCAADAMALPAYVSKVPSTLGCGTCHLNPAGSGDRNSFGAAFAAPHEWTADLCAADSDGDGASNGTELADPDCMWVEGDAISMSLSNPGDAASAPPEPPMGGEMPPAGGEMAPAGGSDSGGDADDDDGGCSATAGSGSEGGAFIFGLLALVLFRRRRA